MKIYLLIFLIISIHCTDINQFLGCAIKQESIKDNMIGILRLLTNLSYKNYNQVLIDFLKLFPLIKEGLKTCLKE